MATKQSYVSTNKSNFIPSNPRPPFQPTQVRKTPYPNKIIDDTLVKDFFGRLL